MFSQPGSREADFRRMSLIVDKKKREDEISSFQIRSAKAKGGYLSPVSAAFVYVFSGSKVSSNGLVPLLMNTGFHPQQVLSDVV